MQKFNKKEYIESIKSLHSADQADSIESLPFELQSSILKTHTKNFHPDFIAYLREETRDDILHMIPNKQLVNFIKYMQNTLLLTQLIKAQIIQYGGNIFCIFTDKL